MTCKEKLIADHPSYNNCVIESIIKFNCPWAYNYLSEPEYCKDEFPQCIDCWNREIPDERENAKKNSNPKCDDTSEMDDLRMENEIYRKAIEAMKVELTKCNAMFRVIEQFTDTRLPKVKTDF